MSDTVAERVAVDLEALAAEADDFCLKGMWTYARRAFEQLYALNYKPALIAQRLGDAAMNEGDAPAAVKWCRVALALADWRCTSESQPYFLLVAQEHLIFFLDPLHDTTDEDARAERANWWTRFGQHAYARRQPHTNWAHPEKRLRVGYVTGDCNFHSAAMAFVNVITRHSGAVEPVFYSTLEPERYDHRTALWQSIYGNAFVDVSKMSASELALTIRADGIDILVDLSGYTGNNRLLTFAEKPAPIQIQAWGYVLGTNSPAIDVIFADPIVASPAIREQLVERVVDLPAVLSYHPRPDLPEANALPCLDAPPVFSVFQRASKVTPAALAVWKTILQRVPGSRLMFKGGDYSPTRRIAIADAFGAEQGRITFDFSDRHLTHMLSYQDVDLALDCWPQTGGVSTLEALWMGVPTVTLIGERMIQRASASFLTVLGFEDDCVATTTEDYIDKAVALVTMKREKLAWMRQWSRARLCASPIMTGYVEAVEAAYRSLWREWCAKQKEQAA